MNQMDENSRESIFMTKSKKKKNYAMGIPP